MSDIRKILEKLDETTAGAVATVAQPLFKQSRVKESSPGDWADWGRDGTDKDKVQNKFKGLKKVKVKESRAAVTEADLSEQDLLALKFKPTDVVRSKKHDHEVPMALDDLQAIIKRAQGMIEVISSMPRDAQIPGWVQTKIGRANDSLVDAADHVVGTAERGEHMLEADDQEAADLAASQRYDELEAAKNGLSTELGRWATGIEDQLRSECAQDLDKWIRDFGSAEELHTALEEIRDEYENTTVAVICTACISALEMR